MVGFVVAFYGKSKETIDSASVLTYSWINIKSASNLNISIICKYSTYASDLGVESSLHLTKNRSTIMSEAIFEKSVQSPKACKKGRMFNCVYI